MLHVVLDFGLDEKLLLLLLLLLDKLRLDEWRPNLLNLLEMNNSSLLLGDLLLLLQLLVLLLRRRECNSPLSLNLLLLLCHHPLLLGCLLLLLLHMLLLRVMLRLLDLKLGLLLGLEMWLLNLTLLRLLQSVSGDNLRPIDELESGLSLTGSLVLNHRVAYLGSWWLTLNRRCLTQLLHHRPLLRLLDGIPHHLHARPEPNGVRAADDEDSRVALKLNVLPLEWPQLAGLRSR